jgi:hypothetical protein
MREAGINSKDSAYFDDISVRSAGDGKGQSGVLLRLLHLFSSIADELSTS